MPKGVYVKSEQHRANLSKSHKGKKLSEAHKQALKDAHGHYFGKDNWNWKGDNVGYNHLHDWIRKTWGTPKQCENCGTEKAPRYEWANISGQYLRDKGDWKRLCASCHRRYDHNLIKLI